MISAEEAVEFIAKEQAKVCLRHLALLHLPMRLLANADHQPDRDADDAAKALVEAAYKKGSTDNITVLVIYFHWHQQQPPRSPQP